MKLRIKGNSVRLRLSQSEVAEFAENGKFEDRTEFGDASQSFVYSVIAAPDAEKVAARFENGRLSVIVPQPVAERWTQTEETGISAEQEIAAGKTLRILIEKDFACRTPRDGEDDADSFPQPASESLILTELS